MTSTHAQPRAWGWWDPRGGSGPGMAKDRCGAERGDSSRDGCAGGLRDGARAGGCSEHPRQRPVRVSSSRPAGVGCWELAGATGAPARAQPLPGRGCLGTRVRARFMEQSNPCASYFATLPGASLLLPPPQPQASPCPGAALPHTAPRDKGPTGPGCHQGQKAPPAQRDAAFIAAESAASPHSLQT